MRFEDTHSSHPKISGGIVTSSELTTIYLSMELNSPVIVGACPLTIQPEQVRQFAIAGAGAITLPSIMQEQIVHAKLKDHDPDAAICQSGYQPQQDKYNGGVDAYLETIRTLKTRETIPIFASINAARSGEWIEYAEAIQSSGADALELNWPPIITHPQQSADEVESYLVEMVRNLCDRVSIPVAVKLNQRFTNLSSIAHKLQNAGADGLVVFSHLPEWDVSVDRLHWTVRWELSPTQSFGQVLEGVRSCADRANTGRIWAINHSRCFVIFSHLQNDRLGRLAVQSSPVTAKNWGHRIPSVRLAPFSNGDVLIAASHTAHSLPSSI